MRRYPEYHSGKVYVLAAITGLLAACHPAHKITASEKAVRNELCAEAWLPYPAQPHPMWTELKPGSLAFPAGSVMPKKYRAYQTSPDTLLAFFKAVRQKEGSGNLLAMILPTDNDCEPFLMQVSDAVSPGLQAKYPDMVSLQGNGLNNKASDLRLDWDGHAAHGQLLHHGTTYLLTPVTQRNEIIYLMYKKEDAGEAKQPFEIPAAGDRTPGTLITQPVHDR